MATYSSIAHNFTPPSATTSTQTGAGAMTLIKTLSASSSSNISFVDGTSDVVLDNTYKTYVFKFINCHPGDNGPNLNVNFSIDTGSNYNVTKTTTFFHSRHDEDGTDGQITYDTGGDLAQATGNQYISRGIGNGSAEDCVSGELWLFNPSSTTFLKHFIGTSNSVEVNASSQTAYFAGYCNTTSAVDAVRFAFNAGNIDAGTFKMYGIA
jgi:hypothetical protein